MRLIHSRSIREQAFGRIGRRTAIGLALAAFLLGGLQRSALAQRGKLREVLLRTAKLDPPLAKANMISIRGKLGGAGEIVFDQNGFSAPDQFGDSQPLTEVYYPPLPVTFRQLKLADPTGKRRKVYEIVGTLEPKGYRYFLVSPSRKTGVYRLVVEQGKNIRRVVTLEPFQEKGNGSVRVPVILKIDYSIQKSLPPTLVVTATGQVPTLGWTNATLHRRIYIVPPADGIWEYDLHATPPSGGAGQVISTIKATNRWHDYNTAVVKGVRIYGDGPGVKEVLFGEK